MQSLFEKTVRSAMEMGAKLLANPTFGKLATNRHVLDALGKAMITASRVREKMNAAGPVIAQTLGTIPVVGSIAGGIAAKFCNDKGDHGRRDDDDKE